MDTKKHQWIIILIAVTIVTTIAVQFYWNYKNYIDNKTRVNNEIQNSLDNAIDEYYSTISKDKFLTIVSYDSINNNHNLFANFQSDISDTSLNSKRKFKINSLEIKTDDPEEFEKMPDLINQLLFDGDSMGFEDLNEKDTLIEKRPLRIYHDKKNTDSLRVLKGIQSVMIAFSTDSINMKQLDSLFLNQLAKNSISTPYYFEFKDRDSILQTNNIERLKFDYKVGSKSTYLRDHQSFITFYKDPTAAALRKSSFGILLSFILSSAVILCLIYLLKIINQQKKLSEIKNDLISNITHEFKTPITTIGIALEGLQNFDAIKSPERAQSYVSMSQEQLIKLNLMVEKLLETATLKNGQFTLEKERADVVSLIKSISEKQRIANPSATIQFSSALKSKEFNLDILHFENAILNLIDNAIKYGNGLVEILIQDDASVLIMDNGPGIPQNEQKKIFEQFYRIPTGNVHDVKGFGIGLHYTKKIIEKHEGNISVHSKKGKTIFKISLAHGS
ncbi:MAG: hypothetical protein BM563_04040 [Bacteroidetes bacterium MedPE-SWsnd-G1]|nr:MAG: hypothetical protein BM563_04040 [Bacteroidetes bacterium MedPE-SWsnd-G1]